LKEPAESRLFNSQYDGTSFSLKGSTVGILLLHGFTATTVEVRGFAEYLHTHLGISVNAPLLPGHGTTPHDLANTGYQEWIDAVEVSIASLQKKTDQVLVAGESMGGLLSLYLAAVHPEILGVLVYAPALIIPDLWKAKLLHRFIFSSPKDLQPTQPGFLPWQGYRENPLKAVVELGKLKTVVLRRLKEIRQPIFIFQGRQDKTIDIRGSKIIFDSVSSSRKELIELDNCGHCILLDKEHDSVFKYSVSLIQSITGLPAK
jgi:carboxylesterase